MWTGSGHSTATTRALSHTARSGTNRRFENSTRPGLTRVAVDHHVGGGRDGREAAGVLDAAPGGAEGGGRCSSWNERTKDLVRGTSVARGVSPGPQDRCARGV